MRKFIILTAFILSACTATAMKPEEIRSIQANCSNVDSTIAMLEKEKAENDNRIAASVGDFLPVTALARFVTGRYETNSKISTGEWAQMINAKLFELNNLKAQCMQNKM